MQNNPLSPTSMVSDAPAKVRTSMDHADPKWSEEWWDAQQRLLLYLKALRVPAGRSLEIAHRALKRAMADPRLIESPDLTGLAMLFLRKVLADEGLDCLERVICFPEDFQNPGTAQTLHSSANRCAGTPGYKEMVFSPKGDLPVMPPLNRSSMRAEVIERSLLHNLAYKFWNKWKQKHL